MTTQGERAMLSKMANDRINAKDPKHPSFAGPCPRCAGPVPNEMHKGQYPGALSRLDNETYVCSSCGSDEAMYQFRNRLEGAPVTLPAFDQSLY